MASQIDRYEFLTIGPVQPRGLLAQQGCHGYEGDLGPGSRLRRCALPYHHGRVYRRRRHRRMQELVDARGAEPHCRCDLSDSQVHPMRSGYVGDALFFG